MNTSNPFQIPSCLQRADIQQRRRERFRRGVVVAVAAVVALLIVLLIEGCVSEHAKTSTTGTAAIVGHPEVSPASVAAAEPKPVPASPAHPVTTPVAAPVTEVKATQPAPANTQFVAYVVKPGDSLIRIARQHHTTAKTIKAINSLASDMIVVGATLKLPSA